MKDFLTFRRMLTPVLIQLIFWLGSIICIAVGIYDLMKGAWLLGLEVFILGPIIVRVVCEFLILYFRMNETLTEIKNSLCRLKREDHKPL